MAETTEHTRDMPKKSVQLETRRAAAFRPQTVDEGRRTVEVVWTTGAEVKRFGFRPDGSIGDYIEELSLKGEAVDLSRLRNGAPLLNAHSADALGDIVGVVEDASVDGTSGRATVRFSERDDVEPIWRDVQAGIIRNISVGYRVEQWSEQTRKNDTAPRLMATRWTPYELSLVPIPADAGARVRAAGETRNDPPPADPAATEEPTMAENHVDPAATRAAETVTTPPPADLDAIRAEATRAERRRIDDIRAFEKRVGGDFVRQHIEAGTAIETVRAKALELIMAQDDATPTSAVRAQVIDDGRDRFMRGASHWLLQRAGSARFAEPGEKLDPGEFRGMSLLDLARHSLGMSGVNTAGWDRKDVAQRALEHRSNITQGVGDFAVLMETVMHKVLLGAYQLAPMTWNRFCGTGSVTDFRTHNRYRLGSIASLETVAEFAEVPFKPIPDGEKQTISVTTQGIRINLSRQAIINDDLSFFNALPTQLGQAAARSIENAVYALLAENSGLGPTMADASPFFDDTAHGNVTTSAAYAMAAIDLDRQKMAQQKDPSGLDYLDLRPAVVLVSLALGGTARDFNANEFDPSIASGRRRNDVRGMFRDVIDTPRLTGNRRYLFADPAVATAIEVAFLEGQTTPMLEAQAGWSTLGQEWRIVHDWGVAALDWRAAVTNAGG